MSYKLKSCPTAEELLIPGNIRVDFIKMLLLPNVYHKQNGGRDHMTKKTLRILCLYYNIVF
jgi:hypothetical protein